ncbi:Uncharacterised protein [Helicobacter canis]|uniref:Uncharacterized protein n=1 Tax=Helicobacter canis TaxID=29419 RepID=A0A377J286_9HELI|nr:Uncharacterised protein [Helicobacter canis]
MKYVATQGQDTSKGVRKNAKKNAKKPRVKIVKKSAKQC